MTKAVRLLRPLGQGGMGKVWVAEHLGLHTSVVVKFMATETADRADAAERFTREAAAAAAVKSPHVVQTFDHGLTEDGVPYIVMELLEGRDLAAYLEKNGRMAPADVAAIVAQAAKALGKAHQVGVVHRDIKPENIFLCDAEGGELFVKVLDFGIAKHDQRATAATTTGQVVGTPFYMSPEQIVGEKTIDARTDVWSLGVVAFEAMVGKRPFQGETIGAVTLSIHTTAPVPSSIVPELPKAFDGWFAQACARDPQARFASVRDAANALLEAVGTAAGPSALVRAPMLSVVREGSDPAIQVGRHADVVDVAPRERAATSLSSTFPVPRERSKPPPIVLGASIVAVAVLAVGGLFALRSGGAPERPMAATPVPSASNVTEVSSGAPPAASSVPPPSELAAPSAASAASAAPSAALAKPVATAPKPGTRPTGTGATSPTMTNKPRPRKPTDDDIK